MSSTSLSRVVRLSLAGALLAAVAACGSASDSSNRNRNAALECDTMVDGTVPDGCDPTDNGGEKKIECEATWDPTENIITFCDKFAKISVTQIGENNSPLNAGDIAQPEGGANAVDVTLIDGAKTLKVSVWTRNAGGEVREAGKVNFTADTASTEKFMYLPDASQAQASDTTAVSAPVEDTDRELVFGSHAHDVIESVEIAKTEVAPLSSDAEAVFTVRYRLNGATPEQNVLSATLEAVDADNKVLSTVTESVDATKDTQDKVANWTDLKVTLKGDFMVKTALVNITLHGDDGAATSGGNTGPRVTSAELKVGETVINGNAGFEEWTTKWNVVGHGFGSCSLTDGPIPCVTGAPYDQAFTSGVPSEDSDTTLPASDTTVASDTTLSAPDSTSPTESTIVPQLIVPRDQCSFTWNAEQSKFVACSEFFAMKVAVYGTDGRYVGSVSSEKSDHVDITEALASKMKYVYYSLSREMKTEKGSLPVSVAREWVTIADATQNVTDQILVDAATSPQLREEGEPGTFYVYPSLNEDNTEVRWDIEGSFVNGQQFVIEVNGKKDVNSVNVPKAASYSIRIFASDEFGFFDYVAGGTTSVDDARSPMQAQFPDVNGLGLIKVNADTEAVSEVSPDDFVSGDINECDGAQPVLYTTPNSPSRSNRVTISLDSDCSSVNGVLAVAVVRADAFDDDSDFAMSVAWWNVSSTRYSSRMTETIYLADGNYSIYFFNPDTYFIKGIDYQIDSGSKNDACKEMSLRIEKADNLAVVEGCDALASIDAWAWQMNSGTTNSSDPSSITEPDIETVGAAIDLRSLPDGWWQVVVFDRQQSVMGGVFALCIDECDLPEDSTTQADVSKLSTDGTVKVTDSACTSVQTNADTLDDPYYYQSMIAYVQSDADHAPRAAWIEPNALNDKETLNGEFTAQFSKPGTRAILSTTCSVDGDAKEENAPYAFSSRGITSIDVSGVPTISPANDRMEDATDITGASEVTLQQLGATLEPDEPLAGFSQFLFDRSLITTTWLKFTAPADSRIKLTVPAMDGDGFDPVTTGLTIYRKNTQGQLGFVTTNMSLAQLIWMEAIQEISEVEQTLSEATAQEFNVKAGVTYYVQVVGFAPLRHPGKLVITPGDKNDWSTSDFVDNGGPDLTTPSDSTVASDTTVATDSSVVTNDSTVTTEAATTSTVGNGPDTSAPSTSGAPASTESPATTGGSATTSTVAPSVNQKVADGMMDLITNGSRNETLPLLAGGGTPTIETRKDAETVTIAMSDLVASVSKSGAAVDPNSRVVITTKNGRHVRMSQKMKSVTLPVVGAFTNENIKVTAYSKDGKELTSTITVKKSLTPLVKVKDAEGSSAVRIYALLAVLLMAAAVYLFTRYARKSGAAA